MAFENEKIACYGDGAPRERWEQYGMSDIRQQVGCSQYITPAECTVDHARDISLIWVAEQRDEDHAPTGLTGWLFEWHRHRLWAEIRNVSVKGGNGAPLLVVRRLISLGLMGEEINPLGLRRKLPPELKPSREEILQDLYDALLCWGKTVNRHASYELTLDLAEGV
ncbi:MAG: hypothetical protein LBQ75_06960 [Zoogloeaceae bacterium]|jgi:hypothetical protein|nr:hypothetical protein [Zoogloeaceae bacterium]